MKSNATPFEALQVAIYRAGSQSAMARLCGVSQTAVWKWIQSSKRLPAEQALKVERETGVSRYLLRPDIYPPSDAIPSVRHADAPVLCDHTALSQHVPK